MRMTALLTVLSLLPAAPFAASAGEPARPGALQVSFKLDPRLSGPTYGGERWISPPTYSGAAAQDTVEAKAFTVDGQGRTIKVPAAAWSASDPEVVTVSPSTGDHVRIVARRPGQGRVSIAYGGATRELVVRATEAGGALTVRISQ